jgi:hypothetical protein
MSMRILRERQLFRLVAVAVVLIVVGLVRAAEPDQKQIARAQKFLEDVRRAKATLNLAAFGATYRGIECLHWQKIVDEKKREMEGYFALTVRYYWAGLLSDDEHTDIVFFFDDKGRFYSLREGETTGLLKSFELSKAVIDLMKEAIRAAAKDAEKEIREAVEAAIKNVDAKALLRLKLILEQP